MEPSQSNGKDFPGALRTFSREENRFYFEADKTRLEVTVVTDHIARFRFTPDYFATDFSYAHDPGLVLPETIASIAEDHGHYLVSTVAMQIHISKDNLRIRIEDADGKLICADENGYHWEANAGFGGNYVYCSKVIQTNECFYGLGDKPDNLNLRGKRFLNWGTDTYGFAKEQDPLYRNIPFFYGLHDGMGYGIFLDNSFQSYFDFGNENPDVLSFWAEGGEMSYYFIAGPELLNVAERYVLLTGRPELPPLWSLGYHQSKWSYYPESRVMEIASEFRKRRIPCDVIHLDIDYMDGFRCFTWDKERFPEPAKMIGTLQGQGFETVVIIDPGIKIDPGYFVYREAMEQGYFCKRQDGDLMRGKVWPGDCHFPDFTNPSVRTWWSGLMEPFTKEGVAGVWNDMNEPAVFEIGTFPDDVRHNYDGLDVSHRRAHNVYGMQMARATYEGMKKYQPQKRPFVLTRSGFSGIQRYAAVWSGDNIASWEHLWIANMQCQRLSVSGISFCGTDIGGFIGDPDGELFVRYIQMAVFHPFFRGHSSNDHGDKEPWAFGEKYEPLIRQAIELRYQLLPLIYTTFWQYVTFGTPMIRSLAFMAQHESETLLRMHEFGFGDHLLICPVKEAGSSSRKMYLPKGHWYNYWSGKQVKGGHEITVPAPADEIPVFVRAGAVIPHYPVIQHTGEPIEEVTLHVYFAMDRLLSYYYSDAGEGYGYRNGEYCLRKLTTFGNRRQFRIISEKEGNFSEKIKRFRIVIHGLPFSPRICEMDGVRVSVSPRQKGKLPEFEAPVNFKKITFRSQLQKG